jgi:hypothetical protein
LRFLIFSFTEIQSYSKVKKPSRTNHRRKTKLSFYPNIASQPKKNPNPYHATVKKFPQITYAKKGHVPQQKSRNKFKRKRQFQPAFHSKGPKNQLQPKVGPFLSFLAVFADEVREGEVGRLARAEKHIES